MKLARALKRISVAAEPIPDRILDGILLIECDDDFVLDSLINGFCSYRER
jgi:hypothetical protein